MVASAWLQWRTTHTEDIAKGTMVPVIQTGLRRNRELPNLPLMQEVIDDPTAKRVIEFISAGTDFGRALIAPPAIPADRLKALRGAFDSLVKDPAFLKDAERAKAQIDPTSGEQLQQDLIALFKAPKDIVERAKVAMD
jgi:tripartite-type tricarboxylate transporter receptor subunit TctC